jgi:hypothetical protein
MNTRCLPRVFSCIQHGAGQIPERKHSTALVSSIAPECDPRLWVVSQSAGGNGIQSNSGQSAAPVNLQGAWLALWRARVVNLRARARKGPRGSAPLPHGVPTLFNSFRRSALQHETFLP